MQPLPDRPAWIPPFSPSACLHRPTAPAASPLRPCKPRPPRRRPACRESPRAAVGDTPAAPPSTAGCIAVLPVGVVQRIASGELLHGVHSVVRELVENSLDAGARRIAVDLDTRSSAATVADDGRGITAEDLQTAAACNATSKLRDVDQLDAGVDTLGFRGQGLWAVASAAEEGLTVQARAPEEDIGAAITFGNDGLPDEASRRCVPMAQGAVVRAAGLQRWGVLDARARRKVRDWLAGVALTRRDVAFRLTVDGRPAWRSDPVPARAGDTDGAAAALAAAYGRPVADFREGTAPVQGIPGVGGTVTVAAGLPDLVRASSARWLFVAVNGRIVQLPKVTAALRAAITLPRGRFPVVLVDVTLPAACVDWNVSPVKSDVRLRGEGTLDRVVQASLKAMRAALRWMPGDDGGGVDADASLVGLVQAAGDCVPRPAEPIDLDGGEADGDDEAVVGWTSFRIISQLLDTYILVEHPEGITLIEQHVADERARYEKLLSSWEISFTPLTPPLILPTTITDEQAFNLVSLGFETDPSESGWTVTTTPAGLAALPRLDLTAALIALSNTSHTPATASAKLACDASVRNGTPLPPARMRSIVRALATCTDARTCPHGRRIAIQLSARALASLFGRPVGGLPRTGRL